MVDDYTHKCLALAADTSLSDLVRLSTLVAWMAHRVALLRDGQNCANGLVESFEGRLRDQCIDDARPTSLVHVYFVRDAWRHDYNQVRPQSKLGWKMSAEIARPTFLRAWPRYVGKHQSIIFGESAPISEFVRFFRSI